MCLLWKAQMGHDVVPLFPVFPVSRALNRNIFCDTVSVNDISLTNFYLSVGVLVDQNQILICVA